MQCFPDQHESPTGGRDPWFQALPSWLAGGNVMTSHGSDIMMLATSHGDTRVLRQKLYGLRVILFTIEFCWKPRASHAISPAWWCHFHVMQLHCAHNKLLPTPRKSLPHWCFIRPGNPRKHSRNSCRLVFIPPRYVGWIEGRVVAQQWENMYGQRICKPDLSELMNNMKNISPNGQGYIWETNHAISSLNPAGLKYIFCKSVLTYISGCRNIFRESSRRTLLWNTLQL